MKNERKIQVLAEADGITIPPDQCFCYFCLKELGIDYLTSRDAIVPAIVKWCDVNNAWGAFMAELSYETKSSIHSNPVIAFELDFKASAEQLSNAFILTMEKWEENAS